MLTFCSICRALETGNIFGYIQWLIFGYVGPLFHECNGRLQLSVLQAIVFNPLSISQSMKHISLNCFVSDPL